MPADAGDGDSGTERIGAWFVGFESDGHPGDRSLPGALNDHSDIRPGLLRT